jgi:cobalamin biosynthetic protein CobC
MALRDEPWQRAARAWLQDQGAALDELLCRHGWRSTGTSLFRTVQTQHAAELHEALARRGVWTRRFELQQPAPYHAVRFGLPADDTGLQRLGALSRHNRCRWWTTTVAP